jgi:hypothetical protein
MYVISDFDIFEAMIYLPDQIFKNCTQKPQLCFLIISLFCLGKMFTAFSTYVFLSLFHYANLFSVYVKKK